MHNRSTSRAHFLSRLLIFMVASLSFVSAQAATPAAGTVTESQRVLTYTAGPFNVPNQTPLPQWDSANAPECGWLTPEATQPCDNYTLTTNVSASYLADHPNAFVTVTLSWTDDTGLEISDYDLYVYKGNVANADLDGTVSADYNSASSANPEIATVSGLRVGTNPYSVKVVPFQPNGETVSVRLELFDGEASTGGGNGGSDWPPVRPYAPGEPRYQNFYAPPGVSDTQGEFNIGYNPFTKRMMTMSSGLIVRVTPPEVLNVGAPESCDALWEDKSALTTNLLALDPILWTDQKTGRTFASNNTTGANAEYAWTDDDGETWVEPGVAPPSGSSDHQTLGSGPYPAPLNMVPDNPVNHGQAVYYCAQVGVGPATCQRSDDLGISYGPAVVAYDGFVVTQCNGLHGHVRVGPDGAAYVPVTICGANEGGVVSLDAGITWSEFLVPTSKPQAGNAYSDPSVAIGANNTLYYCYINFDGHAHAAVSRDHGTTWSDDTDLGTSFGIQNANFPEAVAGDDDRASCGFLGTNVAGDSTEWESLSFPGIWYLFMAHTYDGGKTWTTVNATPNDPVQGLGGIWLEGGGSRNRNLLDFNEVTHDEKGRVLFGYDDGCVTATCLADPTRNDFAAEMRVARQLGGKTLFAANDPQTDTVMALAPKRSCLSGTRSVSLGGSNLKWKAPDNGGADVASYKIYRGETAGTETLVTTVLGTKSSFLDTSASASVPSYVYKITALNTAGEGIASNTVTLAASGTPAATTTTIASSSNPSSTGQSVTFTATVGSCAGTCTGTVAFKDGAASLGGSTVIAGVATFTTSALTAGSHTITGAYSGDGSFAASTSSALTQTVNSGPLTATTTTLVSSANPSIAGNAVSFTATVAGSGGTPTGTITFNDGASSIGTIALSSGQAVLSTSSLTTGSHSITASYAGDSSFASSTSATLTQTVNAAGGGFTITPASICQGGAAFALTVDGSGFVSGAIVRIDGSPRDTTFVNVGRLTAAMPASDIAGFGSHTVSVLNPDNSVIGPATLTVTRDTTGPVVSAPAAIVVMQTTCNAAGGDAATGSTSSVVAAFLTGASAIDSCSSTTIRDMPQAGGTDVNNNTPFRAGTTEVLFRFHDAQGNVGSATSSVTVHLSGDLDVDRSVTAIDLVMLANSLVGNLSAPPEPSDVNRDHRVDAVDLVTLANFLVGNITCLSN